MAANTLLPIGSGHLGAAFLKNAGDISANFLCNKISKLDMKFGEFIITSFFPREERNERQARKKKLEGNHIFGQVYINGKYEKRQHPKGIWESHISRWDKNNTKFKLKLLEFLMGWVLIFHFFLAQIISAVLQSLAMKKQVGLQSAAIGWSEREKNCVCDRVKHF